MELTLTDADLARLEELAAHYASGNALPFAEDTYRESACNMAPVLVAEVRKLRAAKTISLDYMRSLHDSEQEKIAALQARVEALEWWEEVRTYDVWGEHPMWSACGNRSKRGQIFNDAAREYGVICAAAREAIR